MRNPTKTKNALGSPRRLIEEADQSPGVPRVPNWRGSGGGLPNEGAVEPQKGLGKPREAQWSAAAGPNEA